MVHNVNSLSSNYGPASQYIMMSCLERRGFCILWSYFKCFL